MAATHLTLEEAADRLGISTEEFKRRLKTHPAFKTLVPIRDGSSLRFKEAAIEELARELGAGSNPENPLPSASTADAKKGHDEPLQFGEEGDVFSLTTDEPKSDPKPAKTGSDSDVRLDVEKPKSGKIAKNAGGEAVPTEEISIDFSGPGSAVIKGGSSSKLSAPKSSGKLTSDSGKSLANPGTGDSSEFELSLDADSDDFELKLNTDSSDEVALGEMPKEKDPTGSSGRRGGESGILSRNPADSGISLEKGKAKDPAPPAAGKIDSDSDLDFELTLDSSSAVSGTKLGGMKPKKKGDDSDSEFELTLDDSSGSPGLEESPLSDSGEKGDIFETDFEIPPMGDSDSGSEAVALDSSDTDLEKSDFDVALDDSGEAPESGSEVVLLEDEEEAAPTAKKGKGKKAAAEDEGDVDLAEVEEEEEEESSVSKALKGAKARRADEDEEEAAATPAGVYRPVPWGPVPMIFLLPAFVLMLIGGIMGYELLQTMMGYQQPRKPAAPLVQAIAGALDMEPAGQ